MHVCACVYVCYVSAVCYLPDVYMKHVTYATTAEVDMP